MLFDTTNQPFLCGLSSPITLAGKNKKVFFSGQIKGDPYRWTLLNPNKATRMLYHPPLLREKGLNSKTTFLVQSGPKVGIQRMLYYILYTVCLLLAHSVLKKLVYF